MRPTRSELARTPRRHLKPVPDGQAVWRHLDGVTFAVAAGNENVDAYNSSPARVAGAITVGSTTVTIRDSNNNLLRTLVTYSNLSRTAGYVQQSFDVLAYRGLTIRVRFEGREDSSLQTSFTIDDTALNVTQ